MKSFLVLLVVLCAVAIRSQSIHSLDGIENQQGQTVLLYRLGSGFFPYNPVYKFNSSDLSEELIIDAYYINYPSGVLAKAVWDFEYFPDKTNFMNVGEEINPDNHSFIARNDSIVFGGIGGYYRVDISKQDPMKVFAFGGGPITRSFDGGFTFPLDSMGLITDFDAISLADFDDSVLFGINSENQFAKNSVLVDTAKVFFDQFAKVLYDVNQFHIYRANKTNGGYTLNVSNNKGNAYTWTKTYQSENPIFVTIDPSNSGLVYLADGRRIYKSTNNGYNFSLYRNLESRIVGIYKKPGSEILYAATRNKIFEITPDTVIAIRALPIPIELLDWFPLEIGNIWVYRITELDWDCWPSNQFDEKVVIKKDTIIANKTYFKFEPPLANEYEFVRIDSVEGKLKAILHYYPDTTEVPIYDFLMEVGDSVIFDPNHPYAGFTLEQEDTLQVFNEFRLARGLFALSFLPPSYTLVKGIGYYGDGFCEFGGHYRTLKGCVINREVFGDTTMVVSVDDEDETIPKDFALHQNYPNPFNPRTVIGYQLPVSGDVTLKVFDVLGREVATLVDEYKEAGYHEVEFNSVSGIGNLPAGRQGLASGIYFYQLSATGGVGSFIATKKMILLK
jgi:hypothetical protein